MKTVFILMDSLNKHYLNAYQNSFIKTPNLDRIFAKGTKFNNYFCGSMPCMPARRDLFTGRLCFLEAPWGSLEPWDASLPRILRQNGVYTHMITDHYHYFEGGGLNYVQAFDSWEFERGQEGDVWHALVKEPEKPEFIGKNRRAYWVNREFANLEDEEQYPSVKCINNAVNFIENNYKEDNWHLHLELFDPHEPFVCPQKYLDMYDDTWQGLHFDWPNYAPVDYEKEGAEGIAHIRKRYAAVLTMADYHLGKILDKFDKHDMWKDTALILTTDHGHLLGEHGYWAKNYMFDYKELVNIPLCICSESSEKTQSNALASAIDIMPTILDFHHIAPPKTVQGKTLLPILQTEQEKHREAVLYGYHGKDINMFNGEFTYCKQPDITKPTYMYTLCTDTREGFLSKEMLESAKTGNFLPYIEGIPQLKIPYFPHKHYNAKEENPIYNLIKDPLQENMIVDDNLQKKLEVELRDLLIEYEAPCVLDRDL